jgi:hypothetical protein
LNIFESFFNNLGYFKPERLGSHFWQPFKSGSSDCLWGDQGYKKILEYYLILPEVSAIINNIARAESNIKYCYVIPGTTTEIEKHPVIDLIENPNWFQSEFELRFQNSQFRGIFGNEYRYFLISEGMKNNKFANPYKALFTLPPQLIYITTTTKKFWLEDVFPEDVKYFSKYEGDKEYEEILKSELIHLNDNRVSFNIDGPTTSKEQRSNYLYGTSKLSTLTPCLENLKVVYEARNTLRKLPVSIFTNTNKDGLGGASKLNPKEKRRMEAAFQATYGLTRDKSQIYFTNMPVTSNPINPNIPGLMLYEEGKEDTCKICDAYGHPYELLADPKGTTFENRKIAERYLYQNTAIPNEIERIKALNKKFADDGQNIEIVGEYDHLPIFAENMKERGTALNSTVVALNKAFQDGAIKIPEYQKELEKFDIEIQSANGK